MSLSSATPAAERHAFLRSCCPCGIVNGGDGWHAHPTQALLDCYSLRQAWQNRFAGRTLLILGDIAHSRVARSNMHLLTMLGVKVRLCAPRTLLPRPGWITGPWKSTRSWTKPCAMWTPSCVCACNLNASRRASYPTLRNIPAVFALAPASWPLAAPEAKVLHPGPMNRGLEISNDIADAPASLVLNQVAAGVATRMAVLYLLATRNDGARA